MAKEAHTAVQEEPGPARRVTWRALLIGAVFSALFAVISIFLENRRGITITATQIPVLPYALLFFAVALLNPLLRWIPRTRRLNMPDLMIIFIMGMVSSGLSSFGLAGPMMSIAGSLFNSHWNNEQSAWGLNVEPFVHERYFVAEAGIRDAAREHRSAVLEVRRLKRLYNAAMTVEDSRKRLADTAADLDRARAAPGSTHQETANRARALGEMQAARDMALQAWEKEGKDAGDSVTDVLARYPDAIEKAEQWRRETHLALQALEEKAFAKVKLFRRGLPEGQRALPGFFPEPGDDGRSYRGRWRRMREGRRALRSLLAARDIISAGDAGAAAAMRRARDILTPLSDDSRQRIAQQTATSQSEQLSVELAELAATYKRLLRESDRAAPRDRRKIVSRVTKIKKQRAAVQSLQKEQILKLDHLHREALIIGELNRTVTAITALQEVVERGELPRNEILKSLHALELQFPRFDASLWRFVIGDIPWSHWRRPMFHWCLLLGLTYVVLMTLNVLIFRQWAHNEKLVYPLAELPQLIAATDEGTLIPKLFRSGLFWLGFCIAAGVLGWNVLCALELDQLRGLTPLDLRNSWSPYIAGGLLDPLRGKFGRSMVFFTVVGITFMTPKHVSFSLWGFSIFYLLQILVLTKLGYEIESNNMTYKLNFRTAQGGGALLVFASVVLFKCRRYLFSALTPSTVAELPRDERWELRLSSFLFLGCSAAVILVLWRGMGANLVYVLLVGFIAILVNIAFMRAVAEGGLLGFKSYFNPFHFIRNVLGFDRGWNSATLFSPLLLFYAVLCYDVKTLISPAMATSLKIRQDQHLERVRFHLAVTVAIIVAIAASIVTTLMLAYNGGADAMSRWFLNNLPRNQFAILSEMVSVPQEASAMNTNWMIAGALLMASLLFMRRRLFWLPHPIGLIMFVNPMMGAYWFSIFLGWLANALVSKYGSRHTYYRARSFFLGLVVGEILLVVFAAVLSYCLDTRIPIDLNRN